jgi:hypothetical protein
MRVMAPRAACGTVLGQPVGRPVCPSLIERTAATAGSTPWWWHAALAREILRLSTEQLAALGGDGLRDRSNQASALDHQATVHDDGPAPGPHAGRGVLVADAHLHPHEPDAERARRDGHRARLVRAAEIATMSGNSGKLARSGRTGSSKSTRPA